MFLFNLVDDVLTRDIKVILKIVFFIHDIVLIEEVREGVNFELGLWTKWFSLG